MHARRLVSVLAVAMLAAGSASAGEQVEDLKAFHRAGQTFLTWDALETNGATFVAQTGLEPKDYAKRVAALRQADKAKTSIRYHVYRSSKPIKDAASLASAQRVGTVAPLSIYHPSRGKGHWRSPKYVPAVCLSDLKPLLNGNELFVYTVPADAKPSKAYYAVLVARAGAEDKTLGAGNALPKAVAEKPADPAPVLQHIRKVGAKGHYLYQSGPAEVRYYLRWVHKPYANVPRRFLWAVAVPGKYDASKPAALQLMVHGWGGSQDSGTYWYAVKPSCIRISTINHPNQDWWYGYHEDHGLGKLRPDGVIFNYTERRLMSMVAWARTQWKIDPNRIFIEGQSMGGTGAIHVGGKRGETFAYVNAWVGIACWPDNGWFRNGEQHRWGKRYQFKTYNGQRFDDWMDMAWWLRKHPAKETPFISFANGKNDGLIGWEQAVKFLKALQETRRAFVFRWGLGGHGERAIFMFDPATMALDKSLPAFNHCSLDDEVGTGKKLPQPKAVTIGKAKRKDAYDGAPTGQINSYLRWRDVVEARGRYEITVFLTPKAPKDACTVDLTPRRCRTFAAKAGQTLAWTNTSVAGKAPAGSGKATADALGLVTLKGIKVTKAGNRIVITPK